MFRNFHTLTPDNVEGALVETSSLVVFQKDGLGLSLASVVVSFDTTLYNMVLP